MHKSIIFKSTFKYLLLIFASIFFNGDIQVQSFFPPPQTTNSSELWLTDPFNRQYFHSILNNFPDLSWSEARDFCLARNSRLVVDPYTLTSDQFLRPFILLDLLGPYANSNQIIFKVIKLKYLIIQIVC
jgi:hypothetical protein